MCILGDICTNRKEPLEDACYWIRVAMFIIIEDVICKMERSLKRNVKNIEKKIGNKSMSGAAARTGNLSQIVIIIDINRNRECCFFHKNLNF